MLHEIQNALDFHLALANAVSFVPVQFYCANLSGPSRVPIQNWNSRRVAPSW
jgi:hypothetical protein